MYAMLLALICRTAVKLLDTAYVLFSREYKLILIRATVRLSKNWSLLTEDKVIRCFIDTSLTVRTILFLAAE
jgi:hypothetical protein